MLENYVDIGNHRINLFSKRFRSKAPLAVSLPTGQFVNRLRVIFGFLLAPYGDAVSRGWE